MADSSIFDVFTFPLIIGNPNEVLSKPNSAGINRIDSQKILREKQSHREDNPL